MILQRKQIYMCLYIGLALCCVGVFLAVNYHNQKAEFSIEAFVLAIGFVLVWFAGIQYIARRDMEHIKREVDEIVSPGRCHLRLVHSRRS